MLTFIRVIILLIWLRLALTLKETRIENDSRWIRFRFSYDLNQRELTLLSKVSFLIAFLNCFRDAIYEQQHQYATFRFRVTDEVLRSTSHDNPVVSWNR